MARKRTWKAGVALTAVMMSIGCSSEDEETTTTTGTEPKEYAALVRAQLASMDLTEAKLTHDQIASQGEQAARAAGDIAHDVLLGTALLDSIPNEFLAIDRWTDEKAMQGFYADPDVQQAFGGLFAIPPTIEFFEVASAWVSWGDMTSGDAHNPYYVHLALGTLRAADPAEAQAAHDQVAAGGKQPSIDAGNVAHVVFTGLHDPRRFVAVDIWQSDDNIEPFYTNPQFQMAFGPLFESVTEPVYQSTDWHQW